MVKEVDNLQGVLLDNSVDRSQTNQQQGRTWSKDTKGLTINQRLAEQTQKMDFKL